MTTLTRTTIFPATGKTIFPAGEKGKGQNRGWADKKAGGDRVGKEKGKM